MGYLSSNYINYKKYAGGGGMGGDDDDKKKWAAVGTAASAIGNTWDAMSPPNEYGRQSMGANIAKNVGNFASMGMNFGPIGGAIGAAVGAGIGLITGNKQKKEETRLKMEEGRKFLTAEQNRSAAILANDPTLAKGIIGAGYFAAGGHLPGGVVKPEAENGSLERLSSDSFAVNGPSHEGGGVQLPEYGAEVEGKESIKGSYVFSHQLGFAAPHKKIARVIGSLEKLPPTPERVNTMKVYREREQNLALAQEYLKSQLNLQ